MNYNENHKQRRFDNSRTGQNFSQNRSEYIPVLTTGVPAHHTPNMKSYTGVSSFRGKSKKY